MTRASFTVDDAARIANAVRVVEFGNRNEAPLRFGKVVDSPKTLSVRLAYWTATSAWFVVNPTSSTSASTVKTISFAFPTAATAAQTALCVNHMAFLPAVSTNTSIATRLVLVMKEAGSYRLIGAAS